MIALRKQVGRFVARDDSSSVRVKNAAVQQWHPKPKDLDAISAHCEEAYKQRRKTGALGGWTQLA